MISNPIFIIIHGAGSEAGQGVFRGVEQLLNQNLNYALGNGCNLLIQIVNSDFRAGLYWRAVMWGPRLAGCAGPKGKGRRDTLACRVYERR